MKRIIVVSLFLSLFISLYGQENPIADAINKNRKISLYDAEIKADKRKKLYKGWSVGLNFGATKFQGDITQYDNFPAYQQKGDFYELRSAILISLEKRVNSLYSLSTEFSMGEFAGLRRSNEYIGYDVYDPWSRYEGKGDKFVTSYREVDLLLNVNLSNAMTYFGRSNIGRNLYFKAKIGGGINIFSTIRRNLFTDTYVHDFGYELTEDAEDLGTQQKPFSEQIKEAVYVYGISANYRLNARLEFNIDYTVRNGRTDKWDASIMSTQYKADKFSFLSLGLSYKLGNHNYKNEWTSPIDVLKEDVSMLNISIEGFTDDSDNDGVADSFDKEPNTPLGVAVDGSGNALDVDMDNVPDYRDSDPFSNKGVLVDLHGVEFDDDKDGVPNSTDLEKNTPLGSMVNQFGMQLGNYNIVSSGVIYFPSIYFDSGSAVVTSSNDNRIATIALLLKNNPNIRLNVIGHTDNIGSVQFNRKLGLKRADAVIRYLVVNYNIDTDRLLQKTKGEESPLSSNMTIERVENGRSIANNKLAKINRRVDFQIAY